MMTAMPARTYRLLFGLALLGLAGLGCNLVANLPFVATPTPTATATPSPSPTPTPTPTPLPAARIEAGEQSLFNGDWEQALVAYEAARLQSNDPSIQAAALLGIGLTHLRAGDHALAIQALTSYLDAFPDHVDSAAGSFFRAQAHASLGQYAAAIADYDRYLAARPGRIDAYLQENVGDLLRQNGQPAEAVARYRSALAAPHLEGTLRLELKLGRALFESGAFSEALTQFDRVYALAGDGATRATANYLAGQVHEAVGEPELAYARYQDSVDNYPQAFDAYSGLIRLVEAGVPVDEYQRGFVDFNAGAYEPALAAFDRSLAVTPSAAGYYYRGLTRRALGNPTGAIEDFNIVIQSYPGEAVYAPAWLDKAVTQWAWLEDYIGAIETYLGLVAALPQDPSAPDALFSAARTAERIGDLTRASTLWLRIPAEYPASPLAFQGAFEAGIARYRLGEFPPSLEAFRRAQALAAGTGDQAAASLWLGKALQAQGDIDGARAAWQQAASADPTGYYAERARELLEGRAPFSRSAVFNFAADLEAERLQAEAWLRENFVVDGPEPLTEADAALAADPRFVRAQEFWRLGLYLEAKAEIGALREALTADAEATYRLLHELLEMGLYRDAIFAARHILALAGMDDAATMTAPVYFNRLRFGPYFGELIIPAALQNEFDGLFLLSVVRQESLFEGFATSFAAARGLMQIIPSTGAEVAARLGWPPGYDADDLYRPVVSVRLGTAYLSQQRELFDGDLYAALAAYNAGPGNALIWHELAPDDPDLFLEVIRLAEPHRYIRTIYEVYAIYQRLYGADS